MNDQSITSCPTLNMSGLIPTITATNVLGNLTITAANTMNVATTGTCTVAATGILNLGSAAYTSLESLRINNNAVSKDGSADLTFSNVSAINATAGSNMTIATTGGELSINSTVLKIDGIATASAADIVYYDPITKAITHATAPSGVISLSAGSNISIDNAIPTTPVIAVSNPLTSAITAGDGIPINGTSTDSVTQTASFGNIWWY
jgi:hypothetical protein